MRISKYLSYNEVIKSYTASKLGIKNIPSESQLKNIIEWARNIFDPVRSFIGKPLGCHTIYRSPELNKEIKGSPTSQHMANKGAAGDIDADIYGYGNNIDTFNFIRGSLDFDQLIAENIGNDKVEWIHCSYVSPEENRKEVLMMYIKKGKKYYEYYDKERFEQLLNNEY